MKRLYLLAAVVLSAAVILSGCAPAAKSAKTKIGLVFDLAGRGDNSFNDSAYRGLVQIAKEYKGWIDGDPSKVNFGTDVQIKYLTPKSGGQDRELLMRGLAQDGYQLIYGVGFAFADALGKVAKDFPKTTFAIIDSYVNLPNVTGLEFKENEGSFLVGAAAGLMAKKGEKVGFLGGVDIPLIHRFDNGFVAGAMYINPALRAKGMVLSQYISKDFSGFSDPTGGYNVGLNLYKQGASIVFAAAGSSGDGLFKAAEETKKLAIGVDSDQGLILASSTDAATQARAKTIVTSMVKRVDNAVFSAAKEFIDTGKLTGGEHRFGLKEDGVGFATNDFNKDALAPYVDQLTKLRTDIIAGTITVPDETTDMAAWAKTLK
jgi:basic membrane protein A and related proteins